jgi:hypothetical protein
MFSGHMGDKKFRKVKSTSPEDAIKKINTYVESMKGPDTKKEENNHKMLLIAGQSLKNAGQIPESMLYFLKLQENLPNTKSSYEQIFCKVYENDTKIILEGINSLLQRNQNSYLIVNQQRIPLQAVLFNLRGFVTIELNHQPQEGMTYYKKCLEIYPEYKGIKERIK